MSHANDTFRPHMSKSGHLVKKTAVATYSQIPDRKPQYALVAEVDLVVVRFDDDVVVFYGRCLHRGALMSDGYVRGRNLICGLHDWDCRLDTGVSEYANEEKLPKFTSWVEGDEVLVDADEIAAWAEDNPQPFNRDADLGLYADTSHGTAEEPLNGLIQRYAKNGLRKTGHHGEVASMGVPSDQVPSWDDIQILTAQLHKTPFLEDAEVGTEVVIGPNAQKPLTLKIPLFVSDMSFGAMSDPAKVALARGAELAGTGICSGEGGMLPEERAANSRYFYELASARFWFDRDKLAGVQAFHFKGGQGAKTGTGGHLPGHKNTGKIAEVRGIPEGEDAINPPRFPDWESPSQIKDFADEVRDRTGGIPIGYKLSAQNIEKDIDAALEVGVDYIILDGRAGGTGAAPILFRGNISVPTIPALARARRHLDVSGRRDVTLVITGGLRKPADFIKAMARGRRDHGLQRGHAGDRMHRRARVPHQQLPGRHRLAKAAPRQPAGGRDIRPSTGELLRGLHRTHAGHGPRLWPRPPVTGQSGRSDDREARHGRLDRHRLRRRGMSDLAKTPGRVSVGLAELPKRRVTTVSARTRSLGRSHVQGHWAALKSRCRHPGGPPREGAIERGEDARCEGHGPLRGFRRVAEPAGFVGGGVTGQDILTLGDVPQRAPSLRPRDTGRRAPRARCEMPEFFQTSRRAPCAVSYF
jgi:glutamate synthase domain-containing protein 2